MHFRYFSSEQTYWRATCMYATNGRSSRTAERTHRWIVCRIYAKAKPHLFRYNYAECYATTVPPEWSRKKRFCFWLSLALMRYLCVCSTCSVRIGFRWAVQRMADTWEREDAQVVKRIEKKKKNCFRSEHLHEKNINDLHIWMCVSGIIALDERSLILTWETFRSFKNCLYSTFSLFYLILFQSRNQILYFLIFVIFIVFSMSVRYYLLSFYKQNIFYRMSLFLPEAPLSSLNTYRTSIRRKYTCFDTYHTVNSARTCQLLGWGPESLVIESARANSLACATCDGCVALRGALAAAAAFCGSGRPAVAARTDRNLLGYCIKRINLVLYCCYMLSRTNPPGRELRRTGVWETP